MKGKGNVPLWAVPSEVKVLYGDSVRPVPVTVRDCYIQCERDSAGLLALIDRYLN